MTDVSSEPTSPAEGATSRPGVEYADPDARKLLQGHVDSARHPERSGWHEVKRNDSRIVYRREIDGQQVYLKTYRNESPWRRAARWLGRSDARREMDFLRHLSSRGIDAPPPLAAGCANGTDWLMTRAVAPAEAADCWHERQLRRGPEGRRAIREATVELARTIGRMHSAGVSHSDLHCGNILIRHPQGPREMVVTDLHRARRRGRLSRRTRAMNLAQLMYDRLTFTTRSDRLRFLRAYMRAAGAEGSLRGWQLLVEYLAGRHMRAQHARRDRRMRRTNRYFGKLALPGGWTARVVKASKRKMGGSIAAEAVFQEDDWRAALADPDALLTGPGGEVVKDSDSALVVRRELTVGEQRLDVYVKRSRRKAPWKVLIDCLRPSRAIRAFRLGHALLTRRIATALPLAALERRAGAVLLDSILITEAVEAPRLQEFLRTWLGRPPAGDDRLSATRQHQLAQEVLWQLGRIVQKLHDLGFAHRDLKATNLMVHWDGQCPPDLVLIDLDGLKHPRVLTMRRRFQGIMRLNVSLLNCPVVNHAGRLRMLLGYLRRPGSGRINFKPYWRMLETWSARKLRRQIRARRQQQKATRRPRT